MQPRKMKHRKWQKGRSLKRTVTTKGTTVAYGSYGLKALEGRYITDRQIESAMKEIKRALGKKGRMWLRIFPHLSRTKKPAEVRMGSGKGDVDHYATMVYPGRMMFEVDATDSSLAIQSLKRATHKLPIATKIVSRVEHEG